ncbi:dienelactone hydrolase family protein [Comamonas guangdongensis]|uniref:Dienelactone hydrolase family protein n=1 Tax=Comamonas guangdongensis TaxID=510515 RepID=A0ABV3ZYH9_9BURK
MQILNEKTWRLAGMGAMCLWTTVASAQFIFDALPPLPKVVPMMPSTVLQSDTQGDIRYKSSSPYDLDVLLNQPAKAEATMGMGRLILPRAASDRTPVPAMVILPGGAGVIPGRENETAQALADNGIAALVVDSFKPRGISEEMPYALKIMGASEFDAVADAYAALKVLNKHPAIDAKRIGLMGFSKGGIAARMSMDERIRDKLAPQLPAFALHVDFYGPCYAAIPTRKTTGAPLLSFRAGADASNDLVACAKQEAVLRQAGSDVSTVVYARAGHDWESNTPRELTERPYLAGCTIEFNDKDLPTLNGRALIPAGAQPDRQTRYQIRVQSSKALGDCVKVGYISGRDETARSLAGKQLLQFLKARFEL